MKQPPSSKYLRLAFVLALLAVLGTAALCALLWLRVWFLRYQAIAFAAPIFVLNIALNEPEFQAAVRWIVGFNGACCLGAAWFAWPALQNRSERQVR